MLVAGDNSDVFGKGLNDLEDRIINVNPNVTSDEMAAIGSVFSFASTLQEHSRRITWQREKDGSLLIHLHYPSYGTNILRINNGKVYNGRCSEELKRYIARNIDPSKHNFPPSGQY